jgi:hypothetical protein
VAEYYGGYWDTSLYSVFEIILGQSVVAFQRTPSRKLTNFLKAPFVVVICGDFDDNSHKYCTHPAASPNEP